MKKLNFRICVACVLIIVISCGIGASSVSAISAESEGLPGDIGSAVIDLGGIIGSLVSTTEQTTAQSPADTESAKQELGAILNEIGLSADILAITDLVAYLNRGGSFTDWIYDNYGADIEIPESVKAMPTSELVIYLMGTILYPDSTSKEESTTPGYVFTTGKNDSETTTKKPAYTTVPTENYVTTTEKQPQYKTGDVDADGKVTAKDARLALRAGARIQLLEGVAFSAADVNGDGRITANDARSILRYSAKITNGF